MNLWRHRFIGRNDDVINSFWNLLTFSTPADDTRKWSPRLIRVAAAAKTADEVAAVASCSLRWRRRRLLIYWYYVNYFNCHGFTRFCICAAMISRDFLLFHGMLLLLCFHEIFFVVFSWHHRSVGGCTGYCNLLVAFSYQGLWSPSHQQ